MKMEMVLFSTIFMDRRRVSRKEIVKLVILNEILYGWRVC